jgi:hypothetical protein
VKGYQKAEVGQTSSVPCGCKGGLKPAVDFRLTDRVIVTAWDMDEQ